MDRPGLHASSVRIERCKSREELNFEQIYKERQAKIQIQDQIQMHTKKHDCRLQQHSKSLNTLKHKGQREKTSEKANWRKSAERRTEDVFLAAPTMHSSCLKQFVP